MKPKPFLLYIIISIILTGCGVSQSEYDKLKSENANLKEELNKCHNSEGYLGELIDKSYIIGDHNNTRMYIRNFYERYPGSNKNIEYARLLNKIDLDNSQIEKGKKSTSMERKGITTSGTYGIWGIDYYVDEYGEMTTKKYIINILPVTGTFRNVATNGSPLNVQILVDSSTEISLLLYEYGRSPVKSSSYRRYWAKMKDCQGQEHLFWLALNRDRISFENQSEEVHNILIKGGKIQCWIHEDGNPINEYLFTINNGDGYSTAYEKLVEK